MVSRYVLENSSPEEHALYVWKHFIVKKCAAKRIDIVAHSYGGIVATYLANDQFSSFKKRVNKIAFTDSVHDMAMQRTGRATRRWMVERAVNWVSSPDPLDTPQHSPVGEVRRVSAGTKKHEETSWRSFDSIFKFFAEP